MASDKNLQRDILENLFCRLGSVKSLLRSSAVCKTWYHIIHTDSFAKIHLTYQKTSPNANKYILHQDSQSCSLLTSIDPLFDGTKYSKLRYSPRSFERDINNRDGCKLIIHGICDGLLCISSIKYFSRLYYRVGDNLHLWNPICRKAKKLPELNITDEDRGGVSFGYYDNDYKVIVITRVDRTFVVCVYSLTSNCWNIIHTDTNYYEDDKILDFSIMQRTKFVDGIAYMITSSTHSAYKFKSVAICFDLRDETIYQFKCPKEFYPDLHQFTMEAYGETIAVWGCDDSNRVLGRQDSNLSMWVLLIDKFTSESRWEKKLGIEMRRHDLSIPVGFLSNGKYLARTTSYFEDTDDAEFFLYDMDSPEVRTKYGSLKDYIDSVCKIDSDCVESLLLLNEHSVNPIVHKKIKSCSSKLFTLLNTLHKESPPLKCKMKGNKRSQRKR